MRLGADFTIATPAFPDNGRTVFKGHLFVGDVLLSESGMKNHPLTPMRDANLVKVLQAQCRRKVGLIDYRCVAAGAQAVRARIAELRAQGVGIAIVDAVSNEDLMRFGRALADLPLVTAGSGVAIGLPQNFGTVPAHPVCLFANGARDASGRVRQLLASDQCPSGRMASGRLTGYGAWIQQAVLGTQAQHAAAVAGVLAWAKPLLPTWPRVGVFHSRCPDGSSRHRRRWAAKPPALAWSRL